MSFFFLIYLGTAYDDKLAPLSCSVLAVLDRLYLGIADGVFVSSFPFSHSVAILLSSL